MPPVLKLELGSAAPSPLPSVVVPVGTGAVVMVVGIEAEGASVVAELAGAAVLVAPAPPESFSRPAVMVMGMR
jgi:hypothetical protein